jgi:diguanylate cyclase (GGDEF)-like protein
MKQPTILLIDDDPALHTSLDTYHDVLLAKILHATAPEDGIRQAVTELPDLILLDLNMPRMDGLKVCSHLKETECTRDIPILFLTEDRKIQHLAKALECGANDYILKPFNIVELKARVRVALRIKLMFDILREQARVDALTSLKNRAAMEDALESAIAAYRRSGQPFSVIMLDLDNFKKINDNYGHGVGDEVLRTVGNTISNYSRPYDTACRLGGDEFGVIVGHTEGPDAEVAARRIVDNIHILSIPTESGWVNVRCSAGLASSSDLDIEFEAADILKLADRSLYTAKENGKAQLAIASKLKD